MGVTQMPSDYSSYYSGPKLVHHGGKCCGIKTLYNLGADPTSVASSLDLVPWDNSDATGEDVHCNQRFFTGEAPQETYLERVQRYIAYCKKRRPAGLIETCIVVNCDIGWLTQDTWVKPLEKLGFIQALEWRNSNTGRLIRMYYLAYNETGHNDENSFVDDDPFEEDDDD